MQFFDHAQGEETVNELIGSKRLKNIFLYGCGLRKGGGRCILFPGQGEGAGHRGRVRMRQERDQLIDHGAGGPGDGKA